MQENRKRFNNIVLILLNIIILVGFSLITKTSFKGIVTGKNDLGELVYLNSNLTLLKTLSIISIVLLVINILFLILNSFNIKLRKIDLEVSTVLLLVSIFILFVFPIKQDKRNYFSFSFALANIIVVISKYVYLIGSRIENENNKLSITIIAEGSVLAALAIVLSLVSKLIPFLEFPQGGSVSLSMLPLFIFGLRRGFYPGIIMGFLYGVMNFITDGFLLHWGSIFFDYLIPFSLLTGIAGLYSKKALEGSHKHVAYAVIFGGLFRYVMHSLSGVIFFSEYAGELNPWFYSFVAYNLPYMLISTILSLIIALSLADQLVFSDSRIR